MKHTISVLIIAVLTGSTGILAQSGTPNADLRDLAFYADVMTNASDADHRLRAHNTFYSAFSDVLRQDGSQEFAFEELKWITQVTSPDSTFRILSWQVMISENEHKYYGFVQLLGPQNGLIELNDTRSLRSEFGTHTPDTWYGALYYGIQPFVTADNATAYMLLGFNANDAKTNQRVADVMTIDNGTVIFGMEVFLPGEQADERDVKSRILLEYADAAAGMMRFDRERELLVYDHMITIFTDGPEAGPLQVPDGSYHAYAFKKGFWHFTDKLFNVIVDEPPRDRPDDGVKRDLMGRPVKKQ